MPNVIEFGAATGASAVAVFLGLAFWPQFEHSATLGKPAVSQPVFVVAPTEAKPQAGAATVASAFMTAPAPASSTPVATPAVATVPAAATTAPAAAVATAPAAPPVAASAATVATVDAAAMAKLAVALQTNPAPAATRSMSLAAAVPIAARVSDEARRLCAQELVALAAGDIAGARLYLERAAENGDARALLVLGETYDPVTLARMGALGVKGEAVKARDYYARALAAGMGAARERIAALEAQ